MTPNHRQTILFAAWALPLIWHLSVAHALIIDNFEEGPINPPTGSISQIGFGGVGDEQAGIASSNTIRGVRQVSLSVFSNSNMVIVSLTPDVPDNIDDAISLQIAPTVVDGIAAQIQLRYGGSSGLGDLNVDLTSDGADRFQVVFTQAPTAGQFRILAELEGLVASSPLIDVAGPATYNIPFSEVTHSDFGTSVGLTDVRRLSLILVAEGTSSSNVVYKLSDFRTVPEPVTNMPLLVLVLLWALGRKGLTSR